MARKSTLKRNEFIEIEGQYYFVVDMDNNDNLSEELGLDMHPFGTWFSCIDSRGKRVTVCDILNTGDFAVVHKKWIGNNEIYNSLYEKLREWYHENFFTKLVSKIQFISTYLWAKRNDML